MCRLVKRFAPTALMLGNVVAGCTVIAPAGMLRELSNGLGVSVSAAGLLITFGEIVLCIGSPLTAWRTSRIDRRILLAETLLAAGSAIGGFLYARDLLHAAGYVAAALVAVSLIMVIYLKQTETSARRRSIRDPRQHRPEVNAGQLQRRAFEVDHAAVVRALQRERDHVVAEQRLEDRVGVMSLGRYLDLNAVAVVGVITDEGESGIAASKLAVDGVNHAGAGSMNGMKFDLV